MKKQGQNNIFSVIEVTGDGTATRKDTNPTTPGHKVKLHGLMHLSGQDKARVSILWHDERGGMQHYWNRKVCKFHFGTSGRPCKRGDKCTFMHIGDAELSLMEQKYVDIL